MSNFNGEFSIKANVGEVIRFTSIVTERKDIKITTQNTSTPKNLVQLKPQYRQIEEVVINFKPTGVLKTDVLALKSAEKKLEVVQRIGLPTPTGDGYSPNLPVASLKDGGLSFNVETIYDAISGDLLKKKRLKEYEIMTANIKNIRNYFGENYFTKLKIPTKLIDNFLQFVYTSDNLRPYLSNKNFEATKPYLEKYLPIYLKRLQNSNLMQIVN